MAGGQGLAGEANCGANGGADRATNNRCPKQTPGGSFYRIGGRIWQLCHFIGMRGVGLYNFCVNLGEDKNAQKSWEDKHSPDSWEDKINHSER